MRVAMFAAVLAASSAGAAPGEAWVAFYSQDKTFVAFERASVGAGSVNLLNVSPKNTQSGLVLSWNIVTQVHQFNCGKRTYRLLTKKLYDQSGKLVGDDTKIVTAMNDAFKDRVQTVDTEALEKAYSLACAKTEPMPSKPFASMGEALAWMTY